MVYLGINFGEDSSNYEKIVEGKAEKLINIDAEIPFSIPPSWQWTRLGDVCGVARGGSPRPIKNYITEDPSGINWIKIGDTIKGSKYINSTKERIKVEGLTKSRFVRKGDFLLTNSMSFGRPYILNIDGAIHDGWLVMSDKKDIFDKNYLYLLLSSPFAYSQFCGKVSGAVVQNLNSDKVSCSLFPLPPQEEQKRIVEKVEELFSLIDEIDKNREELKGLGELSKSKILDLAIRGKLVAQDENEESADVLLEKIRTEKQSLVKAKKIKVDKKQSQIIRADNDFYELHPDGTKTALTDLPFPLPANWTWCKLGDVCEINPRNKVPDVTIAGFIPMTLLNGGYENRHSYEEKQWKFIKSGFTHFANGDVALAKITPCFQNRKSAIISNLPNKIGAGTTELHILRNFFGIYNLYMLFFVKTPYFIETGVKTFTGTAGQQRIGKDFIEEFLFPLPPLAEQKRIVARIESLFEICDKLLK